MVKSLVIGYGNDLRGDDGIGTQIAQIVAGWRLPKVRSLPLHQLSPELAADLAEVDLVIFVDACQGNDTDAIKLCPLKPLEATKLRSHFSDPIAILSLTLAIYGKCPQAWWLVIPGVNFGLGDRLSSLARQGIERALIQIKNLILEPSQKTESRVRDYSTVERRSEGEHSLARPSQAFEVSSNVADLPFGDAGSHLYSNRRSDRCTK